MFIDFVGGFLGALGGMAAGIPLVKYLAGKFIDQELAKALEKYKFELNKELAELQGGMQRLGDVLSRRNEREFAVTEKAWELLIEAFGTVQSNFSPGKPVPAFKVKTEEDALQTIAGLPFTDDQKEELRHADQNDRDEIYEEYELERNYVECHKLWAAFKNYVSTHEIFFAQQTFERFIEIRNDVYGIIVHVEMFVGEDGEDFTTKEKIKVNQDIKAVDDKVKALAVIIRERFGFNRD